MLDSEQLKAARGLLRWKQEHLANRSGIGIATIKRMEALEGPVRGNAQSVWKVQRALEDAGIVFIDENGGGAGVRLRDRRER